MSENHHPPQRELRSFIAARDPSVDRLFRPRPERQVCLFNDIEEDASQEESDSTAEDTSRATTATATESECSIQDTGALVYLRLRPVESPTPAFSISEEGNVLVAIATSESTTSNATKATTEKHFSFSDIFGVDVDQRGVFERCISRKIDLEESFTIMTYGTSGSGKTFTLLGDAENPGIVPRALENIFTLYAKNIYPFPSLKLVNGSVTLVNDAVELPKEVNFREALLRSCEYPCEEFECLQTKIRNEHDFETVFFRDVSVLIWISFVEIYNENVYDLLAPAPTASGPSMSAPQRKNLKIVSNDGKVFIKSLTSVYVKTSLEALAILRYGLDRVTYASTLINKKSSRSHCVFIVDVLKYNGGVVTETSYKFCDLAGSERLQKTANVGNRLKEAQRINTSLMVLGRCLDAASSATRKKINDLIPFRESKLTLLLQAALLGREKLSMIVNVTPADRFYEENLNVLNFASKANSIIFKPPTIKSRYSLFLNGPNNNEANGRKCFDQLLEETVFLRGQISQMVKERDEMEQRHKIKLFEQEHELRKEFVSSMQSILAQNKEQCEIRMERELARMKADYEKQTEHLIRKYEEQLDELREQLDEQKENESDGGQEIKKRRTLH